MEASFDADDRLVILQVRPITTLSEAIAKGREALATSDQAMMASIEEEFKAFDDNVGGIDLNPAQLNLETQGENIPLDIPTELPSLQNLQIEGLTPIIIQIVPITNLPMILGATEEKQEGILSLSQR